jgi:hypothetical protein
MRKIMTNKTGPFSESYLKRANELLSKNMKKEFNELIEKQALKNAEESLKNQISTSNTEYFEKYKKRIRINAFRCMRKLGKYDPFLKIEEKRQKRIVQGHKEYEKIKLMIDILLEKGATLEQIGKIGPKKLYLEFFLPELVKDEFMKYRRDLYIVLHDPVIKNRMEFISKGGIDEQCTD